MFNRFKGGKLPPKRLMKMPALGDFLDKATVWPAVPAQGWEFPVDPLAWGMLGNGPDPANPPTFPDGVGNCAVCGIQHLIQAQSSNTGNPLHATTPMALALYSAVTGFNVNDPDSDQGTALTDLLTYVKKHGVEMLDANGKTVTVEVVGSASLDIGSIAQMRYGTYTLGGSYLGINCPERCEDDTTNWNFDSGLPIGGGHCIPRVGQGGDGGQIVSWGMRIPVSNGFLLGYLDEGYGLITKAWLNAQNQSPTGLDLNGLVAAMKAL
jgi:hypothetical protein